MSRRAGGSGTGVYTHAMHGPATGHRYLCPLVGATGTALSSAGLTLAQEGRGPVGVCVFHRGEPRGTRTTCVASGWGAGPCAPGVLAPSGHAGCRRSFHASPPCDRGCVSMDSPTDTSAAQQGGTRAAPSKHQFLQFLQSFKERAREAKTQALRCGEFLHTRNPVILTRKVG